MPILPALAALLPVAWLLCSGYLLWKHGDVSEHQAETIGSVLVAMQGLAAFFLGLFVSLVLSRW